MNPFDTPSAVAGNRDNLERGLAVLRQVVERALAEPGSETQGSPSPEVAWQPLDLGFYDDGSPFGQFIKERQPYADEYVVLLLALVPHVRPALLEQAIEAQLSADSNCPEIGGVRGEKGRAFLPTGETAAFLLAANDTERRFEVQALFGSDHWFAKDGILHLEQAAPGQPVLSGRLILSQEWIDRLTVGTVSAPAFSESFPAERLETRLDWDDLILEPATLDHLEDIRRWLLFRDRLEAGAIPAGHLRSGYRALFHGPPGTGKTLAASLLGKLAGLETYRIDLATVTSKYIGETEKNLASLFDTARRRNWVLFFDEADALFGKRTAIKDSHDRYANITVSYLLERVMAYDGLAILATNLRGNIDEAFLGRFETFVRFSMPGEDERRRLWLAAFPVDPAPLDSPVLADALARYELSGRAIVGAVHTATLAALDEGAANLTLAHALRGVQKEIEKEGRVFQALE